jgi:beta-lactamase regulating signal transducer with metallopeptidase domain
MEALVHFTSSFAPVAAGSLLSAVWEGLVLAACVLLCLRLLPRLSAAARSVVWLNVLLLLVLLQFVLWVTARVSDGIPGHTAPLELNQRWSYVLAGAWVLLSALRGIQLIASAIRLHGLASRATPTDADPSIRALLQIRISGGRTIRTAELCTSTEVARPSVLGFFHPRILIPPALLERLPGEELQQVVLHEMEHLRRGDDWTNLLQKLALVLFPLNPALLWVERRLCVERELACDDSVLRVNCGRKSYALCLTHLAEYSMLHGSLSLALGAWERQSELVRRVHRILRRPGKSFGARQTIALTGGLTLACLLCAVALARSPQLISFVPHTPSAALADLAPHPEFSVAEYPDFGARAQLIKAVMPQQPEQSKMPAKAVPVSNAAIKKVVVRNARRPEAESQQAWVVMTEWSDCYAPPQVVLTVSESQRSTGKRPRVNRISYAAVPFANGWLIVRI